MDETQAAETLYLLYPRKIGKRAAVGAIVRALARLRKSGCVDPTLQLTERVRDYSRAVSKWPLKDRAYIPHPATWFNQDRFLDDPAEWKRDGGARGEFPDGGGAATEI